MPATATAPEAPRELPAVFTLNVPFQFAESSATETDAIPFQLHARNSEPVPNAYWGAIYHDFAGMEVGAKIPVDWRHNDDEIIGFGDTFTVKDDGLHIAGKLIPGDQPGDRVRRLKQLQDNGVPFEASIDFRGFAQYEEVPTGRMAQVNGQQIEGPALIVRKWTLRGVAICPHGVDKNTESQFSAGRNDRPQLVEIFSEGTPVSKATMTSTANPNTADAGKPDNVTQTLTEGQNTGDNSNPDQINALFVDNGDASKTQAATFAEQVAKFSQRFGAAKGCEYLAAGQTYQQSLELHVDHLTAQMGEKDKTIQQLNEKLQALHTGEKTPATMSQDPAEGGNVDGQTIDPKFAAMGKRGLFAAGLQFAK